MTSGRNDTKAASLAGKILGHAFADKTLVRQALTHPSLGTEGSYQRLEFLGDRVVGLVMAEKLFGAFPAEAEGKLNRRFSALVRRETLGEIALELGLAPLIRMTEAVERTGGRENPSILADVLEALIGALYLDAGFDVARGFIETAWAPHMAAKKSSKDPKSALQEWAQGRGLPLPKYKVVETAGPDHAPSFAVEVSVEGLKPEKAKGLSKKQAETKAAKALYQRLTEKAGK